MQKFKSAEDKLNYCWKKLGVDYPYYQNIISEGIRFEKNNVVQTMGICNDTMKIIWNEEFVNKLDEVQCEDILQHEILHHIMMHDIREKRTNHKELSHMAHNVAEDLEINCMIKDMKSHMNGKIDLCFPDNPDLNFPMNLSYEEYLELMVKKDPQGLPMSGMIVYDPDGSKAKEEEQKTGIKGEQFDENGNSMNGNSKTSNGNEEGQEGGSKIDNKEGQEGGSKIDNKEGQEGNSKASQGESNNSQNGQGMKGSSSGSGQGQGSEPDESTDQDGTKDSSSQGQAGGKPAFTRVGNIIFDHNGTLTKGSGSDIKKMKRQNMSEQTLKDREEYMKSHGIGSEHNYSENILTKIKKIKYPWYKVLRDLIISKCPEIISGDTYETYSKLNRYKGGLTKKTNIIYRGFYNEVVEYSIAIIMDVSGSMGTLTDKMYGILKSIEDEFEDKLSIDVLETDSEVCNVLHDFKPDNSLIKVGRGGGTDMESALDFIKENKLEYDFQVIMTDNEVPWSGRKEFLKNTIVLSTDKNSDCPYKQYEVTFK